jgi:hypothetical protein
MNKSATPSRAKALRNSPVSDEAPRCVEFYHPILDKFFRIENHASGVVIRTDDRNVNDNEKRFLIDHLAAEGFVDGSYRWFSHTTGTGGLPGVQWITDSSWIKFDLRFTRSKERFTRPIIATSGLLLLVALILLAARALSTSH